MKRTFVVATFASLVAFGCTGKEDSSASTADDAVADDGGSSGTGNVTFGMESATQGPVETTGMAATDDGNDDTTGGGPSTFITMPDGGGVANECDQWTQDCPTGEKCMPWANDGSSAWNATRCTPIAANPGQIGDDCMVEGSGVSGIDSCDIGSMCYYVDPESGVGQCVGMCLGTPEAPVCDPGLICSISNNGVLTLCRQECDPLLQDCDNSACLPAAGAEGFVCIVDASGDAGAAGDACNFLNSCDPGLFCGGADGVPDCVAGSGCCTEFCDLTDPDPGVACTLAGADCVPWFEAGSAPPGLDHVGGCLIPA
jgi:hypothetical protein